MKKFLFLLLFSTTLLAQAQEVRIAASLIHGTSFHPIPAAHVVNISKNKGTITTQEGYFSMLLDMGDTLKITALGFADLYLPITDSLLAKTKNLRIELHPVIYELAEVNLTPNGPGKFQRDFERVPIRDEDAPEPGRPFKRDEKAVPPPPTVQNLPDYLYEMFGSRPRQLRQVQELRRKDFYQEWIAALLTTKVMNDYLMIPEEYHAEFLYFYASQAFHPLDKEYQVFLTAKQTLPYFFNAIQRK